MVYSDDEKRTLNKIFDAFKEYIQGHQEFDIVYSEKIGYVRLQVSSPHDEIAETIRTPENLLDTLFTEIINEVVYSSENSTHAHMDSAMTEQEKAESCRRITSILETMEEPYKTRYLAFLENYMEEYK